MLPVRECPTRRGMALTRRKPRILVDTLEGRDLSPEAMRKRAEACRLRIQTTAIIERLQKHAIGRTKMSPTQVQAAQALLKKTLPDLVGVKADIEFSPVVFNFAIPPQAPEKLLTED
jgi:hypothetical protein